MSIVQITWRQYYRNKYENLRAAGPDAPMRLSAACRSFDDFLRITHETSFSDLLTPEEWEEYLDDPERTSYSQAMGKDLRQEKGEMRMESSKAERERNLIFMMYLIATGIDRMEEVPYELRGPLADWKIAFHKEGREVLGVCEAARNFLEAYRERWPSVFLADGEPGPVSKEEMEMLLFCLMDIGMAGTAHRKILAKVIDDNRLFLTRVRREHQAR